MASPVLDTIAGSGIATQGTTTWTHPGAASLPNGLAFVEIAGFNSGGTSYTYSCTYGGQSMTEIGNINGGVAWADFQILFGLKAPPAGSQTVIFTVTGSTNDIEYRSLTFTSVDQTTPWDGYTTSGSNVNLDPISTTIASRTNDLPMDFVSYADSTVTISCNQTQLWQGFTNPNSIRAAGSTTPGTGSVTLTWTFSNSPTGRIWQSQGINIRQSAASSTTQTQTGKANIASASSQIGRPGSDVTQGSWISSISSSLYATISGLIQGDPQYIYAPDVGGNTCEVHLSGLTTPITVSGVVVTLRAKADNTTATLTVGLYQGASLIQQNTFSNLPSTFTTLAFLVTPANALTISDYTNLRFRFTVGP